VKPSRFGIFTRGSEPASRIVSSETMLRYGAPCSLIHAGTCGGRLSSALLADLVGRTAETALPRERSAADE
jgi:hypothetical protein